MEERQIMEEFDKVQKQLTEDLRQQLVKPTTRALRKEGQEASALREPLISGGAVKQDTRKTIV